MSAWLPDPVTALWQSSALIVLAAIALRLFGERLSAKHALRLAWLPFLPLILPASLGNEVRWQASWLEAQPLAKVSSNENSGGGFELELAAGVPEATGLTPLIQHSGEAAATLGDASEVAVSAFALLWITVALGLGLIFARGVRRTERQLRSAQPVSDLELARVHALVPESRGVELLQSAQFHSPAAWGWIRPRIVLPPDVLKQLDDAELAWVIRHELAHHARRDLHSSTAQRLLQILWWFHPLLWLWQRRIEELRELACDARAAQSMKSNPRPAADALLAIAAQPETRGIALGLHSHRHNPSLMKTRLTRIMRPRVHRAAGFAATLLTLTLGLGTAALGSISFIAPSAVTQEPAPIAEQEPPPPPVEEMEEIVEEVEPVFEEAPVDETVEESVTYRAQLFLMENQRQDGSWPTGVTTNEASGEFTSLGVTALALLALENRHPSISQQRWSATMHRGMEFLYHSFDQEAGLFLQGKATTRAAPDHFIATRVALRLHEHADRLAWLNVRQRAVRKILDMRNPYAGWRYGISPDGESDTVMTSMATRALGEALKHNLEISPADLRGGLLFLDDMADADSGRYGYQQPGSPDPRFYGRKDDYPAKYTELCTASALLAYDAAGFDILNRESALRGVMLVASKPPIWNRTNGSVDYYYWMYGAEAMNLVGGRIAEHWHQALREALANHQRPDGSWPAIDAWSADDAIVHSTAVALLSWQAANGK